MFQMTKKKKSKKTSSSSSSQSAISTAAAAASAEPADLQTAVPSTGVDSATLTQNDLQMIEGFATATGKSIVKIGSAFVEFLKEKCSLFVGFHLLSLYESDVPVSNKLLTLYLLYKVKDIESCLRPAASKKPASISSHTFLRLFMFVASSNAISPAERLMAQLILTQRTQPIGNLTAEDFLNSVDSITKQVPKLEAELSDVVVECEEYMIARQKRWSAASLWHSTSEEFDELADTSSQMESTPLPNLCSDVDYLQSKEERTEDSEQRNAGNAEEAESATAAESSVQDSPRRLDLQDYLAHVRAGTSLSPIPTKTVVEFIRKSSLDNPLLVPFFEADPLLMSSIIQTNHKIASELICRKVEDNPSLIERYVSIFLTIEVCVHCIEILDRIYKEVSNVPVEPLHEYIRYCVNSCEQIPLHQQQRLNRMLRLVSLFLIALLKSEVIKPNTISSELNPFILKFSGHKDMTVLYQALAEAQSREAKNKKA
ncbi:hypothetical protein WR25_09246 [Diploscapter pachys]|uniref:CCR4-NOT transcription complex subunit 11 n=1 Tax=Diploscapter pachys TaxID=2018661 RepID=A0A2A2LZZ0_9BILA|nr:hypothetical protein WR25_09246 [Diploscapter pachys]